MGRPRNPMTPELTRFHKARAQARFRGEQWELTFKEWLDLWQGRLDRCGRSGEDLSLHRLDRDQGWCILNVEVVERRRYLGRRDKIPNNQEN